MEKVVCNFNMIQSTVTLLRHNDRICGVYYGEGRVCVCALLMRISIFVHLNKACAFRFSGQNSRATFAKKSQMSGNVDK